MLHIKKDHVFHDPRKGSIYKLMGDINAFSLEYPQTLKKFNIRITVPFSSLSLAISVMNS